MSAHQTSLFPESRQPERKKHSAVGLKHVILFGSMKGYTIERAIHVSIPSVQWYLRRLNRPVEANVTILINRQSFLAQ